jgi:ABC-type antimicrobial peptide transport system permease subunit
MVVLFFLIAGAAAWVPAWRAASLDPNTALREQ